MRLLLSIFAVLFFSCRIAYPQYLQTPLNKNLRAGEPERYTEPLQKMTSQKPEVTPVGNIIQLPKPETEKGVSVEKTIQMRRSVRRFLPKDLTIEQISQLLWAAQGITEDNEKFRAAPSAGALYPMEIYLISSSGTYHYLPDGHKMEIIQQKDQRKELANACFGQSFIEEAAVNVIIVAVYGRTTWRYGNRGIRYVDMEAGHIAQNLHLQAVSLGLGSVAVGAFNDEAITRILELTSGQQPIYVIPVGYQK